MSELIQRLINQPSCTCLTKTPDPQYHKEDCEYKIYRESGENISARKPTVICTDPEELAKIYARPGTQSQEEAIRSILKQNGQNN